MDRIPKELHFSYGNMQFRAIFVDNRRGCPESDETCCICGDELNNLAFYKTEPCLLYVHVACARRPPEDIPGILSLAHLPSFDVCTRSLFSNETSAFNRSPPTYYVPNYAHHMYNFPENPHHGCRPSASNQFCYTSPPNYVPSNGYHMYHYPDNPHHGHRPSASNQFCYTSLPNYVPINSYNSMYYNFSDSSYNGTESWGQSAANAEDSVSVLGAVVKGVLGVFLQVLCAALFF